MTKAGFLSSSRSLVGTNVNLDELEVCLNILAAFSFLIALYVIQLLSIPILTYYFFISLL